MPIRQLIDSMMLLLAIPRSFHFGLTSSTNSVSMRVAYPLLAFVVLILSSLACGGSTTERLSEAARPAETGGQGADTSLAIMAEQPTAPSPASLQNEQHSAGTQPPVDAVEPLRVVSSGFGQNERRVGYAMLVENPNLAAAIESSQFQVAAYGPDGAVVKTDSGYIEIVLPGQKLGIGGDLFVNENVTVARIEVQVSTGKAFATDAIPAFGVESAAYLPGSFTAKAVGVIHNPFERDITGLRVSAVLYDGASNIIGGGYTYSNFILANSSSGVEVPVTGSGSIARVELYPTLSGLSDLIQPSKRPSDAVGLSLSKHGFGQKDRQVGYGLVLQNLNTNYSIEDSQFHITFYSGDGQVISVGEGYINVLLPNQTLAVGDDIYLDEGFMAARMDVQVLAGDYVASEPLPAFTSENISYQEDTFSAKLTGLIVNPYPRDITNLRVSAVLYSEGGEIIGGGFTYLDFVPANSKSAVEVRVTSSTRPALADLYATVSGLSEIK